MTIVGTEHEVVLQLTAEEVEALDAVRAGVGVLAGRSLDRESAVISLYVVARQRVLVRAR